MLGIFLWMYLFRLCVFNFICCFELMIIVRVCVRVCGHELLAFCFFELDLFSSACTGLVACFFFSGQILELFHNVNSCGDAIVVCKSIPIFEMFAVLISWVC